MKTPSFARCGLRAQHTPLPHRLAILLSFLLLTHSIAAQSPNWTWARQEGGTNFDTVLNLAVDRFGDLLALGVSSGPMRLGTNELTHLGGLDGFLAKYSNAGRLLWARSFGGTNYDYPTGLGCDDAGNVYVGGMFEGRATFGRYELVSDTGNDLYLAKFSRGGEVLWAKRASCRLSLENFSLAVDAAGTVVVAGQFTDAARIGDFELTSHASTDALVAKFDRNGNVLWATNAGGAYYDQAQGVVLDPAGNVFWIGTYASSAQVGAFHFVSTNTTELFVAKLSPAGEVLWARSYPGTGWAGYSSAAGDGNGNLLLAVNFAVELSLGSFVLTNRNVPGRTPDIALVKLNGTGDVTWVAHAGSPGWDAALGVAVDPAGHAYLAGYFNDPATFGTNVLRTSGSSVFVAKYNPDGQVSWVKTARAGPQGIRDVAIDAAANAYVAGEFAGVAQFDSITLTNGTSQYQSYLAQLSSGNVRPSIAWQTATHTRYAGDTAVFAVNALGSAPLSYQWWKNVGTNVIRLAGETNAELVLHHVQAADQGRYSVVASNPFGVANSHWSTLGVVEQWDEPGGLDLTFDPTAVGTLPGIEEPQGWWPSEIWALARQSDDRLLIAGDFQSVNGLPRPGFARLLASGVLDESFVPPPDFDYEVRAILVQSDGRILVGGQRPEQGDNTPRQGLARLNTDGSFDSTFAVGLGASGSVRCFALQPDGRILVGGAFDRFDGIDCVPLVRLHANGQLAPSFVPPLTLLGMSSDEGVNTVVLQPDGKILAGGVGLRAESQWVSLARFNSDGSFDTQFERQLNPFRNVFTLALQPDGRILVGGGGIWDFGNNPYLWLPGVKRLNRDGSLDTSFSIATTPEDSTPFPDVRALAICADGRVLVGGDGYPLTLLRSDGSVDPGFQLGPWVNAIALQPDGRVVVGGGFRDMQGAPVRSLARLNPPAPIPPTISVEPASLCLVEGQRARFWVSVEGTPPLRYQWFTGSSALAGATNASLTLRNVQHTDAGDYFVVVSNAAGAVTSSVAALTISPAFPGPGSVDATFTGAPGLDGWRFALEVMVPLTDGKILIGGAFTNYDGAARPGLARVNPDGSVDETFVPQFETQADYPAGVSTIAVQPDRKILVGGWFTTVGAVARQNLARLLPDGRIDESFVTELEQYASVQTIALQPDGRILIGGSFWRVNGVDRDYLARLHPDGRLDTSFVPAPLAIGDDWYITTLGLQSDGRILVGGHIFDVPWESYLGVARLNADGSLDSEFLANVKGDYAVFDLFVQPDDKILIDCGVTAYGLHASGPSRLNPDGTLDTSFRPPLGLGWIQDMALAPDGKVLLGCWDRAVQLNPDGSLNSRFQAEITGGADNRVWAIAVQPDGQVLVEGDFTHVNGACVPGFARLNGDLTPTPPVMRTQLAGATRFAGRTATFTVSAAGTWPLSYQWLFDGAPIAGANGATLVLDNVSASQAGNYAVIVSNSSGAITSAPALLTVLPVPAGPGSLDITFDPTQDGQHIGLGSAEKEIYTLVPQSDGAVVVGGNFLGFNGRLRRHLARVGANGLLDEGFNNSFGTDGPVQAVALQPDGKWIVGGTFAVFDTESRRSVARLNADGTLDTTFFTDVRFDDSHGSVRAVAVQPDGRILIGGVFVTVNDVERTNLARLNLDGSLDHNFNPPPAFATQYGSVDVVRLLPDGKILIGGSMGAERRLLHRLNPDGSADPSFAPELVGYWLRHLAVRSDGKMYAAGEIDVTGTSTQFALVLVNADGTLDRSFQVDLGGAGLLAMEVQPDDRLLISGWFQSVDGEERARIARLNPDGTLDTSFDPEWGLSDDWREAQFTAIAVGANNNIWLGGHFRLSGSNSSDLIRLRPDGRIDEEFHAQAGAISILGSAVHVSAMALQPDGRLFIGGDFDSFESSRRANLARVLPDGSLDHTFAPQWEGGLTVAALALQPDGKLLVGGAGEFWGPNAHHYSTLVRLDPDGAVDATFVTPRSDEWDMRLHCLALQTDGRILAGGLTRFNSDGSLDMSFHPPELPAYDGEAVHAIVVQPDGKILVGGSYAIGLFRLKPDGSWDSNFVSGVQVGGTVTTMQLQPDGRLLVGLTGGWLSGTDYVPCGKLVRLLSDGRLDTEFNATLDEAPSALALRPDHRILAAVGWPWPCRAARILRLLPNGSADPAFQAAVALYAGQAVAKTLLVQPDGQVLVGGQFSSVNWIPAEGIVRLNDGTGGAAPFVERDLTSRFYVPGGSTYEVMLYAHPAIGVSAYAVEDQPPAGWTVSAISHDGAFDPATGKVKFGPFFDGASRTFSYEVTPAAGATNAQCFQGIASADGQDTSIVGAECMFPAVPHPADCVLPSWRLAIGEVTAYGAAWRRGEIWQEPPNPIPIDYVTRAAALWRGGECYEMDSRVMSAPLWWANCGALRGADFPSAVSPISNLPTAQRQMPAVFVPGEPIAVAIAVQPGNGVHAYALEDTVPTGWSLSRISDAGEFDAVNRKVKWGPFLDATPRSVNYRMTPPPRASGPALFAGAVSYDGVSAALAGPSELRAGCRLTVELQPGQAGVSLRLAGEAGRVGVIETSTDLVEWTVVAEFTIVEGRLTVTIPSVPGEPHRFYRARLLP